MKNTLLFIIFILLGTFIYFKITPTLNITVAKRKNNQDITNFNKTSSVVPSEKVKVDFQSEVKSINQVSVNKSEQKIILNEKTEIKIDPNLIKTEIINPKALPSLEEFKKNHPEIKITIEKLNNGQMNPTKMPTLEQFRKEHPEVKIKVEKLENGKMFPTN